MTKNWLEYDRKLITPTNMNDGIWLKHYTGEHEQLYMTEIPMKLTNIFKWLNMTKLNEKSKNLLRRRTCAVEYDQNNGSIFIFWFRSYSTVHVCRCHTFSVKFHHSCSSVWSISVLNKFFGHIHRSCYSVKWFTLDLSISSYLKQHSILLNLHKT